MDLIKSLTPGLGAGGRRLGAGSPGGAMGGGSQATPNGAMCLHCLL